LLPGVQPGAINSAAVPEKARQELANTIRVCHIVSGDRWAGAEVQAASLLRALASRPGLSLTVILLNQGRLAEELGACGLELKVIPENAKSFIQIFREAARFLRSRNIQILHSHRYKENLLAVLLARTCHIPHIVRTQHGMPEPFRGIRHWKQKLTLGLDRLLARWVTDRVISVSSELREHLERYMDPGKVVVIPNGLDTCRVSSRLSPREAKERLGLPASCRTVGYAGRLEPVKRLDLFLAAAKLISASMPEARFLIVGDGSEANPLREIARATGLEKVVLFLGHRDDIYDVLRALDVFVLCSDHEGLPMVLLEALYLGVPVVARAVGGITDVILDGVTGILTDSSTPEPLAQACVDLLTDAERRERLSAAAVASVSEKFTADRNADQVAALYRALCGLT
jgi:glycosyltransferase involved in cell wall biosynthesis